MRLARAAALVLLALAAAAVLVAAPRDLEVPGVRVWTGDDAIVVANDHGEWTVRTRCVSGHGTTVGPGYVSRFRTAGGLLLVHDEREPGPLNDPSFGGLGAVAWHHARGRPGALRLDGDNAWEVSGRLCAEETGGFGVVRARLLERPAAGRDERGRPFVGFALDVELADRYTHPEPLLRVRYRYRFRRDAVESWVALTQLCRDGRCGRTSRLAFVKEPKVVARLAAEGPLPHSRTAVFDDGGELRCIYLGGGPPAGPVLDTGQCGHERRERVRFDGGTATSGADGRCGELPCLDVVARAYPAEPDGDVVPGLPSALWAGSGLGLDAWAEAAAARPAGLDRDTGSLDGVVWDCHGGSPAGPLQRRWETTGRLDADGRYLSLGALFPAWAGGRGGYDCEPLLRTFGPEGETFAVYLAYSLGDAGPGTHR